MGMAASQARFLGLTARKTNVEYEGQQINQQRTTLANQSANYYNQLLGMSVPVPPSVADYTKTVYSFNDGALTNTITSLMAEGNGNYRVSYLSSWTDDFAIASGGCTSIVNASNNAYYVGADKLKELGETFELAQVAHKIEGKGSGYRLDANMTYTDENGNKVQLVEATYDRIVSVIGKEPQLSDYTTQGLVINYKNTQCYSGVSGTTNVGIGHMEHNLCRLIWGDGSRASVTSSSGVTVTNTTLTDGRTDVISLTNSGWETNKSDATSLQLKERLETIYPDTYQKLVDLYVDTILYLNKNKSNVSGMDIKQDYYTLSSEDYNTSEITPTKLFSRWENFWNEVSNLSPENIYNEAHEEWQQKYDEYVGCYLNAADYTDKYYLTTEFFYDGEDEYLSSLSSEQLAQLYDMEKHYQRLLNETYGEPDNGWYVRYVENTTSGEYEPIFYNGNDMANGIADENGNIRSNVRTYKVGNQKKQEEVKNVEAKLEQDATGRYINLTLYDEFGTPCTYALETETVTDQAKYDDAMNQYEYDKYLYDQAIQEINAKIEITQAEDKNLELRLKQLDTEQNAIQTEMDAVSKVIEKNTESTFKTFG